WQKGAYSLATMAQQQRNALPNNGNPWDVTDMYKQKLTVTRIRRDSLYRQFYNGVFVLKK
ncbi:MAG TPA: hypothetical protein VK808_06390, partial [Bacteroidia bacterium]|nr:hypothetical protein [Bacteroidia bacterium]